MPEIELELFFDVASPFGYMGYVNIHKLAERVGATVVLRPIVVGGVFDRVNSAAYPPHRRDPAIQPNRRSLYTQAKLPEWGRLAGVKIVYPPAESGHPANSVKAMRGCVYLARADPPKLRPYIGAVAHALWGEGLDIGRDDRLESVCRQIGVDPLAFFEGIQDPTVKRELLDTMDEFIARGGFGVPTVFVNRDDRQIYWGNDNLPLLEAALRTQFASPEGA
ncbi:MAG: 2-hydroxychromene-2-carboxylate isomerase [Sphingobium sp.]